MYDPARGPRPIEADPAPGTISGIGMIIETTLVRFMQRVVNSVAGLLSEVIEFGLETFMEVAEKALIAVNAPMITYVADLLPDDSPAGIYLRNMLEPGSFVGAGALMGFAGTMGSSAAGNLLSVLMRPLGYELDSQLHTARMTPAMAIQAFWREELTPDQLGDQLGDLGWSPSVIGIWERLLRPLLAERDVVNLWIRGELGETEAKERLGIRGYTDRVAEEMRKAMRPLTGTDDLVQLMYRGELSPGELRGRMEEHAYSQAQVNEFMATAWRLMGAGDVVELYRREQLSPTEATARLREWGYNEETAAEILEVGRPLTGLTELRSLYWRGELEEFDFATRLKQYGYADSQIAEFFELSRLIPQPPDLISMAVREAFHPQIVADYNYLSEFPPEFGEWMEKQGYSREWAEKYWVAHWRLPSLSMAYEMYHRQIIGEEDLERLFAISDIAPFWRPKLLEAAYTPLTRVDIRRMFQMNVIDRDVVYKKNLDIGYSPENAELMTQFAEQYYAEGDRSATKTDILKAYSIGEFTREESIDELLALNYSEDWASFYVAYEDYKRFKELVDTEVDILEDQYIDNMLTRTDVYAELQNWNLPAAQIENTLEKWDIKKRRKVQIPSVTQLEHHLKLGVIDEGTYRTLLERRHYESDTISRFLQEIRLEVAMEAQKEEERALKEDQRVREKIDKTTYEEIRADLDLQIAQIKLAIAEALVLVGQLTDYDLANELLRQNEELELVILRLREEKARAKLEYTQELKGMLQ